MSLTDVDRKLLAELDNRMRHDAEAGKTIIVCHPNSINQMQFVQPIIDAVLKQGLPAAFYLALDYDAKGVRLSQQVPEENCFPSRLAPFLQRTQIFLQPEIYGTGPASATRIFIGHGQPNKFTQWPKEQLQSFDWYFLYGELELDMFRVIMDANPEETKDIKLFKVGYPKLDGLINGQYDRTKTLEKHGMDPALKTVLYAPAWDPGCSLRTRGLEIVQQLLEIQDINVLVKLHPVSVEPPQSPYFDFYTGGINWMEYFSSIEHPRFQFLDVPQVDPYLDAADVLVTDFSGVALEFMTQDKPAIFIHCPEFYEQVQIDWGNDPKMAIEDDRFNAGRNAGIVVHETSELPVAVMQALSDPLDIAEKRRQLMARFLYNPGQGSTVAGQAIISCAHNELPAHLLV